MPKKFKIQTTILINRLAYRLDTQTCLIAVNVITIVNGIRLITGFCL